MPCRHPLDDAAGAHARHLHQANSSCTNTVWSLVDSNPNLSTLKEAVEAAGLKGAPSRPAPCSLWCSTCATERHAVQLLGGREVGKAWLGSTSPLLYQLGPSCLAVLTSFISPIHLLPHAATLDDPRLVATVFAPTNDAIERTLRDGGASKEQLLGVRAGQWWLVWRVRQ